MKRPLQITLAIVLTTLDPPPEALNAGGAPKPTMKTLNEVEPRIAIVAGAPGVSQNANGGYSISGGGSYYLTGHLYVGSGSGIIVGGSRVTLDLNGFDIFCGSGDVGGYGVELVDGSEQVVVKNGIIRSGTTRTGAGHPYAFTAHGFTAGVGGSGAPKDVTISSLSVRGCAGSGISVESASVERCRVSACGGTGIVAHAVSESVAIQNSDSGIFIVGLGGVRSCTASENGAHGIMNAGTVSQCTASSNGATGILGVASVSDSYAVGNGGSGINGGSITNCTAESNHAVGIVGKAVTGCTSSYNISPSIANTAYGIQARSISNCTATNNQGHGIVGEFGSVDACLCLYNSGSGIWCYDGRVSNSVGSFNNEGISTAQGSVSNCVVEYNATGGITAGGCSVSHSTAYRNGT